MSYNAFRLDFPIYSGQNVFKKINHKGTYRNAKNIINKKNVWKSGKTKAFWDESGKKKKKKKKSLHCVSVTWNKNWQ